jgi:dihydrofolate reductase
MTRFSIVVAVARNGVIGKAGGLAWKISDDLKRFKEITTGHPVLMGRKTYDSIGKPLPNRSNIVISRTMTAVDGVIIARSIDEAAARSKDEAERLGVDEIFIIGGADIYEKTLSFCGRIYLTEVEADVVGDAYFPALEPRDWRRTPAGRAERTARNEHPCGFFILDRFEAADSAG